MPGTERDIAFSQLAVNGLIEYIFLPLQVQRYDKERREIDMDLEHNYSQFGFDYFFDKAQEERLAAAGMAHSSDEDEEEEEEDDEAVGRSHSLTGTSPARAGTSPSGTELTRKFVTTMAQKYLHEAEESESGGEEDERVKEDSVD
jgi:hypothetical protein